MNLESVINSKSGFYNPPPPCVCMCVRAYVYVCVCVEGVGDDTLDPACLFASVFVFVI